MRKTILLAFSAIILGGAMTGCYHTPDGRNRVGVPGKDTIESRYQRTVPQIFQAAKEVLAHNGTLTGENTINNTLEARVDTRMVVVQVDEVEPGVSRVRTQARTKARASDIDLAAEIDKQIALRLK
jgi:hypothetical protein